MHFFQWNDSLSVDEPRIDEDHQVLIALIDELHQATQGGEDYLHLVQIFNKLITHTRSHFQHEEAIMESINYHGLKDHQLQHQHLLERITDLGHALENARELVAVEAAELLRFWLNSHILLSDKDMVNAFHQTQVIT
ncbi:bacteriohemerythrin [Undibacterium fentianense]|uniref:Hemerythrin family protein n=1 Tax=Undibacterium fentianense TaxID=2828728 RepID=A0A941E113_9BURK|nr:bacteriohemerythrin [Undibacterium fentianense]MBR7801249.1 hemerythrin family protein [Undibacterium fentianense]